MRVLVIALAALSLAAQPAAISDDRPVIAHDGLLATLWMQTSVEYGALTRVVYRSAQHQLEAALADKSWTAALEQKGDFAGKPPAIILDIDETVLDNSPAQARQVLNLRQYQAGEWRKWTSERKARPIPGAAEFCQDAARRGVKVFFVSNRDDDSSAAYTSERADTLANLKSAGFPVEEETLLLLNRSQKWTSDKTTRRQYIAEKYRILLLFGDDLNDFLNVRGMDVAQRVEAARPYASWWGERWFVLPNPTYGSFERSILTGTSNATAEQRKESKERALRLEN
jgi:5'-nucleotidase (lipoprotein e(P4) family)